jgi:hypothetical protein
MKSTIIKHSVLVAAFSVMITLLPSCKEQKKHRLNLKVGDQYHLVYETKLIGNTEVDYREKLGMLLTVKEVSDSGYLFESDLEFIQTSQTTPEMSVEYDSETAQGDTTLNPILELTFRPLLDSILFIEVSKNGKIIKPFEFASGSRAQDPIDPSQIFVEFPEEAIQVEKTWTNEATNTIINANRTTNWKVEKVENGQIFIHVDGSVSPSQGNFGTLPFSGEYTIDEATGLILDASINTIIREADGTLLLKIHGQKK